MEKRNYPKVILIVLGLLVIFTVCVMSAIYFICNGNTGVIFSKICGGIIAIWFVYAFLLYPLFKK
ncbi:hypothetical protein EAE89_15060 [Photorhabdus heterorhabditis]|nr:hypothetical protein [Photorhabdus heterorhabditis]